MRSLADWDVEMGDDDSEHRDKREEKKGEERKDKKGDERKSHLSRVLCCVRPSAPLSSRTWQGQIVSQTLGPEKIESIWDQNVSQEYSESQKVNSSAAIQQS